MSKIKTPILIAGNQVVDRDRSGDGARHVSLIADACRGAANNTECSKLLEQVDDLAVIGLTVDAPQAKTPVSRAFKNLPKSIANALGINPKRYFYSGPGGNTP